MEERRKEEEVERKREKGMGWFGRGGGGGRLDSKCCVLGKGRGVQMRMWL